MNQATGGGGKDQFTGPVGLRDVLRTAAATGDWITPYAIRQVQAGWWALEVDSDV